jgi:hypothetical protein
MVAYVSHDRTRAGRAFDIVMLVFHGGWEWWEGLPASGGTGAVFCTAGVGTVEQRRGEVVRVLEGPRLDVGTDERQQRRYLQRLDFPAGDIGTKRRTMCLLASFAVERETETWATLDGPPRSIRG